MRQSHFTVTDTRGSGVLAGFSVSGDLRSRGGNQAVVCQLLHPQIPGSIAIYPIVPRWDPLVVALPSAICGEDQRLRGGCDAWERTKAGEENHHETNKMGCIILQHLNFITPPQAPSPIVLSSFDFNIMALFWKDEGMQSGRYTQKIPSHRKTAHFSGLEFNVALDRNSTRPLKKKRKKKVSYLSRCSLSPGQKCTRHKRCVSRGQN